jgi:hypothetical protein
MTDNERTIRKMRERIEQLKKKAGEDTVSDEDDGVAEGQQQVSKVGC